MSNKIISRQSVFKFNVSHTPASDCSRNKAYCDLCSDNYMLMTDDELAGDIAVDFVEADWKSLSHVECRELNDKETLIIFHFCKPEHVREARILNQPEVQPYLKVDVDNMTLAWHIDAVFGINIINCLRRIDAVKVY